MEFDDVPEWERSKENVRPLRSGRMVESLSKGLVAREDDSSLSSSTLKAEKEKFELALRSYDGEDPLSVWFDYIRWTEQNFPSDTVKLTDLLNKALEKFRAEERYKNDERYVQIWIQYAGKYKESQEAFKYMRSKGIGTKCSSFYIAWAELLEFTQQSKAANQVLDLGIENAAEPRDKLKHFQSELQTRVCRTTFEKMKAECSRDQSSDQFKPSRQALTGLKPSSEGRVGADRVAVADPKGQPMIQVAAMKGSTQSTQWAIYTDDQLNPQKKAPISGQYETLPDKRAYKENTVHAGKWTSTTSHTKSAAKSQSEAAAFAVHADSEPTPTPTKSTVSVHLQQGLSVKKEAAPEKQASDPIFTAPEEQHDVRELFVCCKDKVYGGMVEYSFEELRAIKWRKKQGKEKSIADQAALRDKLDQLIASSKQRERVLEQQLEAAEQRWQEADQRLATCEKLIVELVDSIRILNQQRNSEQIQQQTKDEEICDQVDNLRIESHSGRGLFNDDTSCGKRGNAHFTPDTSVAKRSYTKASPFSNTIYCQDVLNGLIFNGSSADEGLSSKPLPIADMGSHQDHATPVLEPPSATVIIPRPNSAFTVLADAPKSRKSVCFSSTTDNEDKALPTRKSMIPSLSQSECRGDWKSINNPDVDMKTIDFTNFAQQAQHRSTPFNAAAPGPENPDVSEVKTQPKLPARRSIPQPDFVNTNVLSPLLERSEQSNGTSSSSGSNHTTASMSISSRNATTADKSRRRLNSDSISQVQSRKMELTGCNSKQVLEEPQPSQRDLEKPVSKAKSFAQKVDDEVQFQAPESMRTAHRVEDDPTVALMKADPVVDITCYEPPELTEAVFNQTVMIDPSDPFSDDLQQKLLRKVDLTDIEGVTISDEPMPKIKIGSKISVDENILKITSKLAAGGFATTYKAIVLECASSSTTRSSFGNSVLSFNISGQSSVNGGLLHESQEVCVKQQRPACPWELYIIKEVRERLSSCEDALERRVLEKVMDVTHSVFYNDGSILINQLVPFGSLLNLINKYRATKQTIPEVFAMFLTIELLHTVESLHRINVIHGDIKPDNILFNGFPELYGDDFTCTPATLLIDFGRGIDMSKFKPGTTFTANNETKHFDCVEMKTGRPWTFQTDLFGLLGTIFVLIFNTYMDVTYLRGRWRIKPRSARYPSNYKHTDLWSRLFDEYLNIPSCDDIPNIEDMRLDFEKAFSQIRSNYKPNDVNRFIGLGMKKW